VLYCKHQGPNTTFGCVHDALHCSTSVFHFLSMMQFECRGEYSKHSAHMFPALLWALSPLYHTLIIQFFKVYRLEGKWVLEHAVFGGVVRHDVPRNFSRGCRIDQQV
jgi:hypothetical protein